MLRILIFILIAIVIAYAATVLLGIPGQLEAVAFGQRFDVQNGVAGLLIIVLIVLLVGGTSLVKDMAALPEKLRRREAEARRARGMTALARGFEAAAIGDASAAQAQARIAQRSLEDPALTRFLSAQAAQLGGDEASAGAAYAAMLEAPDTEFLGLRGLYAQAMRAGDKAKAKEYADRAFRLRTNAAWAFEGLLELGLERGAWGETREAIELAQKNGLIPAEKGRRGAAALYVADAYAAEATGETALALEEAEAALKRAPGLAPAAVLAARLHAAAGKRQKAAKILEAAFAEDPHPAIGRAHDDLYTEETAEKRAEAMARLIEKNPDAREAKIAAARRRLFLGEAEAAIAALEPLLVERATARDFSLMAEAAAAARPEEGEAMARPWLRRAAMAARDPLPGAEDGFHFTREGWARLVREFMEHGRLAPPPLEDAPRGLSQEELKLLAAPPAKPPSAAPIAASAQAPAAEARAPETDVEMTEDDLDRVAAEREREVDAARKVS